MSFTPGVPDTGQTLGGTKDLIRNNFSSLRTTITNASQPNHIDVNNTGAGKHIFVQMPVQTPGAANLPAANEGGLITQTATGRSELFYARDADTTRIQLTCGTPVTAQNGTSFLPAIATTGPSITNGVKIQWGQFSISGTSTNVVFATAFDTNIWAIVATPQTSTDIANSQVGISVQSITGFTAVRTATSPSITYNYVAIGR